MLALNLGELAPMVKRGPKPKPLEERRRNRLQINVTDEEHRTLSQLAGQGESAASYIRQMVTRHLAAKRRKR